MNYKAIVWDLDGTLLDTLDDLANSVNYALSACGHPLHTREEIRTYIGNGAVKLIERSIPAGAGEEERDRVLAAFREHYGIHCNDETKPYPGMMELLSDLNGAGIPMGIVSNKPDSAVADLAQVYFQGKIRVSAGARPGYEVKPAPDLVWEVLRQMGVSPAEAVYIGDSEVDVITAKNAGMAGIAVTWGFRDEEGLRRAGAQAIAHTAQELRQLLEM